MSQIRRAEEEDFSCIIEIARQVVEEPDALLFDDHCTTEVKQNGLQQSVESAEKSPQELEAFWLPDPAMRAETFASLGHMPRANSTRGEQNRQLRLRFCTRQHMDVVRTWRMAAIWCAQTVAGRRCPATRQATCLRLRSTQEAEALEGHCA
ncbi:unnamed protein product [Symbiodinium sp. CCMP2592]|nr:unnamed protein product [Symbiodinium sp. CCMP2592]